MPLLILSLNSGPLKAVFWSYSKLMNNYKSTTKSMEMHKTITYLL